MGVDVWRRRVLDDAIALSPESAVAKPVNSPVSDVRVGPDAVRRAASPVADANPPSCHVVPPAENLSRPPSIIVDAGDDQARFTGSWKEMQRAVDECSACDLHRSRTRTVFGVGDTEADWMLIGEAPGEQEDRQGEPFVGPAGQLLDAMLLAVGRNREQVYIANIIKCRPPGNRDPSSTESAHCRPWLERQIERVSPRVIMAVGGVAAKNLLGTEEPMWKLRGRVHRYRGIALVAGYHPAYLLRSPGEKRKAWQDLRLVMQVLESER